jgi:hypothetical protein
MTPFTRIARVASLGALLLASACWGRGSTEPETTDEGTALPEPVADADGSGAQATAPPTPVSVPDRPIVSPQAQSDRDLAIRLGLVPPEPLLVAPYLTHADVRELVQYSGGLSVSVLEGVEASPTYNTVRLATEGGYGFALQLWRESSSGAADSRYTRLRQTYFVAIDDTTPVADRAFVGEFEGIRHYAFLDLPTRSVAVVTCQSDVCAESQARALAERVRSRL